MLNRKKNYIETRQIFNHNIFKVNKNKLLLLNKFKLDIILCIIKNDQKQILAIKKKLQILQDKINKYIKKYYKKLL